MYYLLYIFFVLNVYFRGFELDVWNYHSKIILQETRINLVFIYLNFFKS